MALTEDDVRRIVGEELERRTTPLPTPVPPGWPMMEAFPPRACPNGCKRFTMCGNVACPLRLEAT